jgi:ureidoacrylate peracid hydrolase
MKANETAIVFIEFQNDFCKEGGGFFDGVKGQIKEQNTIGNAADCLKKARGKCVTIHCPILFEQDYRDMGTKDVLGPIHKNVKKSKSFRKGTWGGEIVEEMTPNDKDLIVDGKRTCNAFHSSNLDYLLRVNRITDVAFCGFLTNVCVESTARSAYDLGYKIFLLKDCCAALSAQEQKYVEETSFPFYGEVLTHDEFLKRLR